MTHAALAASSLILLGTLLGVPGQARAHCDGIDGPVVTDARRALDTGDVDLALRWVRPENEGEVRQAYEQTRAVRRLGTEAAALADRYFFETVVRLHRFGEGAPYTGLKPAGRNPGPAIAAADRALASGSSAELERLLTRSLHDGLRTKLSTARARRAEATRDLANARAYVAAYVEFIHFAEKSHAALTGDSATASTAEASTHH